MGHQNVFVHISHQNAFRLSFMDHQVPLWVIRYVNAIGCTTYAYVKNLNMEMIMNMYMNLFLIWNLNLHKNLISDSVMDIIH
ncbi:unnamed protein product [Camellia sinensis]